MYYIRDKVRAITEAQKAEIEAEIEEHAEADKSRLSEVVAKLKATHKDDPRAAAALDVIFAAVSFCWWETSLKSALMSRKRVGALTLVRHKDWVEVEAQSKALSDFTAFCKDVLAASSGAKSDDGLVLSELLVEMPKRPGKVIIYPALELARQGRAAKG